MMRQGVWFTKNGHTVDYAWDEKAGEKAFEASMKTIDAALKHPSGRLGGMVGPAQIDTCREGFFKEALQEAKKRGLPMQTHACQAVVEFHEMVRRHGKTPIEWLELIGVLGPDLVIGHGIFLNDHPQIHYPHGNDFERLRDSGAAVAHCPTVFARRGMVMNSIGRYMNAGITVGIGTDTFPHNMLDEIRLVCYLARVFTMNYKMGTTRHAFEAATIGGARILRRPDLGRLAPGAKADFSLVDMSHPYMQPSHEPVRSLIYSAGDRAIRHVYVDGAQVVKDGKVLTVDVEAATAGLVEAQRKRLKTVQPARLGRPHRRSAGAAGLRHEGPPAAVATGYLSLILSPAQEERTRCEGVNRLVQPPSSWTSPRLLGVRREQDELDASECPPSSNIRSAAASRDGSARRPSARRWRPRRSR